MFYRAKPKPSELAAVSVTVCGMLLFFADKLEPGDMLGNVRDITDIIRKLNDEGTTIVLEGKGADLRSDEKVVKAYLGG